MFLPPDDAAVQKRIVATMCSAPLPIALAVLRGVLDWNGVGAIKLCHVPLLVLLSGTGGSNDPPRLRALKRAVEIGVTVGAGHFIQLEVPDQVHAILEALLNKTLAGR